jgi:hypothetical protein
MHGFVAAMIVEGCMQVPDCEGTSVNKDRAFKSFGTD